MVKNNLFEGNRVENEKSTWLYKDAGAIYYLCDPIDGDFPEDPQTYPCDTIIDSNVFKNNFAENKGGALRYLNKNFTTVFRDP